jgi:hypothetical protein
MQMAGGIFPVTWGTETMKITEIRPSRKFTVNNVEISHSANIELEPDEQITFITDSGTEVDVARKSWGYYAVPSLNGRLLKFGLRSALVNNPTGKIFFLLVEKGKEEDFFHYLDEQDMNFIIWLDDEESIKVLLDAFGNPASR